eukprot:3060934-Alexandrium_andersonii.AAC.1
MVFCARQIVRTPAHSCLDSQLAFSSQRIPPHRLSGIQWMHRHERVGAQPGQSRDPGRIEWGLSRSLARNN